MLSELSEKKGVLYVGASVTAQKEGFRPYLHKEIEQWVGCEIPMVVDALGGVGSLFGLANFSRKKEALKGEIGLVIFEYSTGDLNLGITPLKILKEVIQNFVHQLQGVSNNIVIVHNYRSDFPKESGGKIREIYNEVANLAKIPVISVYCEIEKIIEADADWLATSYRDHVHTLPKGSMRVATIIFEQLKDLDRTSALQVSNFAPHALNLELVYFSELTSRRPHGELIYAASNQAFPYIQINEGEEFNFLLKGNIYGIMFVIGPRSCHANFNFGNTSRIIKAFDRNCYYERPHCFPFFVEVPEISQVTISQSNDAIDFSKLLKPSQKIAEPRQLKIVGVVGERIEGYT